MSETLDLKKYRPWESKKFLAFALVCLLELVCLVIGAPVEVTSKLAEGIMIGLPALLLGESHIDAKRIVANAKNGAL